MILALVIESGEALQVAALGVEGGLGVAGDFGHEVDLGVRQACLGRFNDGGNVMGWIFDRIRAVSAIHSSRIRSEFIP
jgi:hypothetical protein